MQFDPKSRLSGNVDRVLVFGRTEEEARKHFFNTHGGERPTFTFAKTDFSPTLWEVYFPINTTERVERSRWMNFYEGVAENTHVTTTGNLLRKARTQAGFTPSEVSKQLGISTAKLKAYETDAEKVDSQTLKRLYSLYELDDTPSEEEVVSDGNWVDKAA